MLAAAAAASFGVVPVAHAAAPESLRAAAGET